MTIAGGRMDLTGGPWGARRRGGLSAIAAFSLGVALGLGSGAVAARQPVETDAFRVEFPGPPRPIHHPLPWGDRAIDVQGYHWENAAIALAMTYTDLPHQQGTATDAHRQATPIEGVVQGWLERLAPDGAAVTPWTAAATASGGRRITGTTPAGLVAEVRLVQQGDRLYVLTALAAPGAIAEPETARSIQQFFDSFQLALP